ncbi:hypothetical protein [Streptomyces chartreusis]
MPDKSSPLWWLFAALSAAVFIAAMLPGMVNARQKVFVSLAPALPLLVLLGLSTASEESVTDWLPVYGAVLVAGALSVVGRWNAPRTFMTWRAENPGKRTPRAPAPPGSSSSPSPCRPA